MRQDGVSHDAGVQEVLLCDVVDRKFYPDDNGCSLRRRDDTLRKRRARKRSAMFKLLGSNISRKADMFV